jgi:hypothetical protein
MTRLRRHGIYIIAMPIWKIQVLDAIQKRVDVDIFESHRLSVCTQIRNHECTKPNIAVGSSDTNCEPEITDTSYYKWFVIGMLVYLFGLKGKTVTAKGTRDRSNYLYTTLSRD